MSVQELSNKAEDNAIKSVQQGINAGIPISLGYIPVAIAFGLLAKSAGVPFIICIMLSAFVYAGASQFVAVQMLMTATPILNIIFLTFILNLRHFLMSATLATRIEEKSNLRLGFVAFGVTDESFSVHSLQKGKLSYPFLLGVNTTAYLSWVIGTGIGYLAGAGLPNSLQTSMGISLYALFIGLLVPSIRSSWKVGLIVLCAAILNSILIQYFQTGTAIIIATIITAGLGTLFLSEKEGEE